MRPAGDKLKEAMVSLSFKAPQIPVVHNVSARPETDPEKIKAILFEQIFSPVQWTACVQYMVAQGITATVECGPGKVLSGLNKRIDKSLSCFGVDEIDGLEQALLALS
jgi:[acyl-carrier-protein] S-malonyltransferase